MPLADDLFAVIPIGEENAVTSQSLWKHVGMWSTASIRGKLYELEAAGLVERKRVMREARPTSLYYRPHGGLKARLE